MIKAKTTGRRVIRLVEGTRLVPTHDFVDITEQEATDKFTLALEKAGEVVIISEEPKRSKK